MANEIPLNDAINQTTSWRTISEVKLAPNDVVNAFTVPMENFEQILNSGAVSIRAYLGNVAATGEKTLLLVGVDANGDDMLDYNAGQYVYNQTSPCPPSCATGSPLA